MAFDRVRAIRDMRRKDYGQALEVARKRGLASVLITCSADNAASGRVILANGGQEIDDLTSKKTEHGSGDLSFHYEYADF